MSKMHVQMSQMVLKVGFLLSSILQISKGVELFHNQFAVELDANSDPDQIANSHGFVNLGQIGSLDNHFLFEHSRIHKRSIQKNQEHFEKLENHPEIKWVEQQKELKRSKRDYGK